MPSIENRKKKTILNFQEYLELIKVWSWLQQSL